MKYQQNQKIVEAIYDKGDSNPYLDAMPDLLPREQFLQTVQSFPALPHNLSELSAEQRRMELQAVQGLYSRTKFRENRPKIKCTSTMKLA